MLEVNIKDLRLKNPLIMASGTFGYGIEFKDFLDISNLGAIVTKGLTIHPKDGNTGIRVYETPSGLLNSIGLENPGVQSFISDYLPQMKNLNTPIIANLGGDDITQYVRGAEVLNDADIDAIELNISCPNVKNGGMAFGIEPSLAKNVVEEVRSVTDKHLMVKLSPNAKDIVKVAIACQKAGADSLSLVNTFKGMAVDIEAKKPVFDNITAGLSGPSIKPIALRMVYEVSKEVEIPIVGIGGITSFKDVLEYIMVGASAVQIGSANLINPSIGSNILLDLRNYMEKNDISAIDDIRGII